MTSQMTKCIKGYHAQSDRMMMMIKLRGNPFDLSSVQVCDTTEQGDEDEVDRFYEELEEVMDQMKDHKTTIVGDLDTKVGNFFLFRTHFILRKTKNILFLL